MYRKTPHFFSAIFSPCLLDSSHQKAPNRLSSINIILLVYMSTRPNHLKLFLLLHAQLFISSHCLNFNMPHHHLVKSVQSLHVFDIHPPTFIPIESQNELVTTE